MALLPTTLLIIEMKILQCGKWSIHCLIVEYQAEWGNISLYPHNHDTNLLLNFRWRLQLWWWWPEQNKDEEKMVKFG